MLATLAACSGNTEEGPIGWWHQLQGGYIAQHRPPPPGQFQPYPSLATVPARPTPVSPADRARIYATLMQDRANATYEARQDPLTQVGVARTDQGLFAPATPPTPGPDATGAALPAATPAATHAASATPGGKAGTEAASPPASPADVPIPAITQDSTPPPPVPAAPPAAPRIAGVTLPVTVPHLPPVAPPTPASIPALDAAAAAPVALAFTPGTATLTVADRADLQALAARRGPHMIAILGFGDAAQEDANSQRLGLDLAISRAAAIARVLEADGVPFADLSLSGAAGGSGGAARLVR